MLGYVHMGMQVPTESREREGGRSLGAGVQGALNSLTLLQTKFWSFRRTASFSTSELYLCLVVVFRVSLLC